MRTLEAEVRDLKNLLDEKEEKIDLLSKMATHPRGSFATATTGPLAETRRESSTSLPKDDIFRVQASPLLCGSETSDSYFMGASSGRTFIGRCYEYGVPVVWVLIVGRCFQTENSRRREVFGGPQH